MGRVIGLAGRLGAGMVLAALATGCEKPPPPPPPSPDPAAEMAARAAASKDAGPKYRAFWAEWPDDEKSTPPPEWILKSAYVLNTSAVPRITTVPEARGTAPTWTELSGLLGVHEKEIAGLIAITQARTCDFELTADIEATESTQELCRKLRRLWMVLRADAGRRWQAGDMSGCVDRLAATYGLIDHCAQQQDLIVAITAGAMLIVSGEAVKAFMEQSPAGTFTPDHARQIQRAMGRLKIDDPVRLKYAQMGERALAPEFNRWFESVKSRLDTEWQQSRDMVDKGTR